MATTVSFAGTSYSVPSTAGENGWSSLSNFLIALANNSAVTTTLTQTVRTATTTPVNVATTDFAVFTNMASASAVSAVLPVGSTGRLFAVVDAKGDAATNNVTLSASSGQLINGSATYVINENNGGVLVQFDGTGWRILASFVGDSPSFTTVTVTGTATVGTLVATSATVGGVAVTTASNTQTLTNKTIAAGSNTITGLTNAAVDAAAAIARSKLASGTASHVLVNDGSGVMSSEAQLAVSRGGTGLTALGSALQVLRVNAGATALEYAAASGDVSGPASATDNALVRFDGTGGKTLQNSTATLSDDGDLTVGNTTTATRSHMLRSGAAVQVRLQANVDGVSTGLTELIWMNNAASKWDLYSSPALTDAMRLDSATVTVYTITQAGAFRWHQYGTGVIHSDASGNLTSSTIVNADIANTTIAYAKLNLSAGDIPYSKLTLTGAVTNADLAGSIAYSKLTLTGAIVNADVSGSAAIAYSKLNLATSIVNADVSGSAAIVSSKLAGRVDSVNPAASELGYMTGTQRAGTNGSSYSTRATTTWPSSVGLLVSVTLNKGLYWVSYTCGGYAASGSASTETYLYVGGTAVTTLVRGSADTSGVSGACGALPVLITADSTVVAVYGLVNGGLSITAPTQELWAMRVS